MIERLRQLPRGLIAVLALSLTLNSIGAGWGLPNDRSWSNDDPTPKVPLRIGQIWCCGDNKYPYLQPLITRAVYAPSVAWWRHNGDIVEPCDDLGDADCFRRPYDQLGWLMRLSRLLATAKRRLSSVLARHQGRRQGKDRQQTVRFLRHRRGAKPQRKQGPRTTADLALAVRR